MHNLKIFILALIAALMSVGLSVTTAEAQVAAAPQLQSQVAQVLRAHPGGVQISPNQIAWHEGSVVLTLPQPGASMVTTAGVVPNSTLHGCPSGWYCFYQDVNWGGRMLQFQDCTPGGTTQYLSNYGFTNQTSSWAVNRSLNFVNVNDSATGYNLWDEGSYSSSSWVGSANNDRADWFICYS